MKIEEVKHKIAELAKEYQALDMPTFDEIQFAEMVEGKAISIIVTFCEHYGYMINGFPTEKRKLFKKKEIVEGEYEDAYFCQDRYQLYLNLLALEKDDVAEILWFYHNSFCPDIPETKEGFLELIKEQIECGLYDIEL